MQIENFEFTPAFDNKGYNLDTKIELVECKEGNYTFSIQNLGLSDKLIEYNSEGLNCSVTIKE